MSRRGEGAAARDGGGGEGEHDGAWYDDGAHSAEFAEKKGPADAKPDAKQATHEGEQQGFGQKLGANVIGCRAYRLANADFTRAFCHADQHDVHDANATDEQGNASHPSQ